MSRYTLADIKEANRQGGGVFFSRTTMEFFGDTSKSFKVHDLGEKGIFLERLTPIMAGEMNMGGVGKLYEFDPRTGHIWSISAKRTFAMKSVVALAKESRVPESAESSAAWEARRLEMKAEAERQLEAEGFRRGKVGEIDPRSVEQCEFLVFHAYYPPTKTPHYERAKIRARWRPNWSRSWSLYGPRQGPRDQAVAHAKDDEEIWWR